VRTLLLDWALIYHNSWQGEKVPPGASARRERLQRPGEGQRDSQDSLPKTELSAYLHDNATEL
jgi:hypothetical protein